MTVAASFDVDLVKEYVGGITQEFLDKGSNVLLGPGMNLARVPVNGRNFEYGTGEDPHLGKLPVISSVAHSNIRSRGYQGLC